MVIQCHILLKSLSQGMLLTIVVISSCIYKMNYFTIIFWDPIKRHLQCKGTMSGGQEVEFHEIKIHFSWDQIHEIKFFVIFHEVKIPNNDLISWSQHFSWDRNCLIMLFRISISWSFLQLTNQSWDQNSKLTI